MNNETIPYVTRNLRHLLAAPNLTETQRTIITRTLATLSELGTEFPERAAIRPEPIVTTDDELAEFARISNVIPELTERYLGGR